MINLFLFASNPKCAAYSANVELGVVAQQNVYDPWGKVNAIQGGLALLADKITYTGHEYLDDLGIIHMN